MPRFELTATLQATAIELNDLIDAYEKDKTPANKQALLECLKEKSSHAEYEVHRELAKLLHHYPELQKWFELPELKEHWEEQLKSYYPRERPAQHLLPQEKITSCHIVLGWACFKQFSPDEHDAGTWLQMAIQYNNLLAIAERHLIKKIAAKKEPTWPEQQAAMQESISELLKTAPLHKTPGYLLLAQAYLDMALLAYAASDQPALAKSFLSADACRQMAKKLEKSSEAEIRNVSFRSVETVINILFDPANDWETLKARFDKFQGIFFPQEEPHTQSVEPPTLATVMAQMKSGR